MSDTIAVVLADDQSLVLAGLRTILEAEPDISVVGQARDGHEAIRLCAQLRPDVVLMDIRMPGVDGVAATRHILAGRDSPTRVVMLTTFDLDEYVYAPPRAGASGFLVKDIPDHQLVAGVRGGAPGRHAAGTVGVPSPHRAVRAAPGVPGVDAFTAREREVWRLVTGGLSNVEIAAELMLGEATVKTHVSRLLAKLSARDRIQLVVLGFQAGIHA